MKLAKARQVKNKARQATEKAARLQREIRREFRSQVAVGITAAFAFLIALTWREPIEQAVNSLVEFVGLTKDSIATKVVVALCVTAIAALGLVLLSKWATKKE